MQKLMHEKSHWFFALLEESFRIDADEKMQLLTIAAFPHLEKSDQERIRSSYKKAAYDTMDMLDKDEKSYDSIDDLKRLL